MRSTTPDPGQAAPFFMLRTPLLPWNSFAAWSEGAEAPTAAEEDCAAAIERDRDLFRRRLRIVMDDPLIREAIFLASPDLDGAFQHWADDPDSEKGARAERSLIRYFSRMSVRPTPFGLFAGCSVGLVGDSTRLLSGDIGQHVRHTRLHMNYLTSLTEALSRRPEVRARLSYRPNTSLYRAGGQVRYTEYRMLNGIRDYHLVAVDETPYLIAMLEAAKGGAGLLSLAESLVDGEVSLPEAEAFIHELIDSQILVSDLQPALTGPEPTHDIIDQLVRVGFCDAEAGILAEVRDDLADIDRSMDPVTPDRYRAIAGKLDALPVRLGLNRIFQTDLVKSGHESTLGANVVKAAEDAIRICQGLFGGPSESPFKRFSEEFAARYEDREVPLVEVLDEESGIGFETTKAPGTEGSPLFDGLHFTPPDRGEAKFPWSKFHTFLVDKLLECQRSGSTVVRIPESDLTPFMVRSPQPIPDSHGAFLSISAKSASAIDAGDFKVHVGPLFGPSGARIFGRFCHADPRLAGHVAELVRQEEVLVPDAVFAEIVHLPEGRIGNILLRPAFRKYEIPFLGRSGIGEDGQIPISDLTVSIRGGRVVLRSSRLGKEVIPRLTNAHNYTTRSLRFYRFLTMLQSQNIGPRRSWNWESLAATPFLPRIEVGKSVLSKATWYVIGSEVRHLVDAAGAERWKFVREWMRRRNLPRYVLLVEGDNHMPVDFDNVMSVDNFIDMVKGSRYFNLEEMFPGPDELPAEGAEGAFVHELILPFLSAEPVSKAEGPRPNMSMKRSFPPGSEWLFAKIYAGTATLDRMMVDQMAPIIRSIMSEGLADEWFFIRYGDPDPHVRIRFHGDPGTLMGKVVPRLQECWDGLLAGKMAWKVQLDTYQRELERYGDGDAMLLSERMFMWDSEAALEIMDAYRGDEAFGARWKLCLVGMDMLLNDMGFDLAGKSALIGGIREGFMSEFNANGGLEHEIAGRYRKERKELEGLMSGVTGGHLAEGLRILATRSRVNAPTTEALRAMSREGRLLGNYLSIASGHLHMHANRLFSASARAHELVIYDFLHRAYESAIARARPERDR